MEDKKWWQSEVVYQIYPRSFKDSNGDGIGDINGIREQLPILSKLGITCIWISPIFKSPMADNGYDISDYFDIAPEFGTMEDFRNLVDEAKSLDIKILLDLVVNHSSDEHPWFREAISNPQSKYRNYYIFKEAKEVPNNWRSVFGGSVWEKVPNEECYYYHTFHKKQPDLNWENPELREEIYEMVNKWLDLGIAGFRIDAITFIKKDLTFASIEADGIDGLAKCTKVSRNQPGIEVFLNELEERCFKPYDCVTVAEAPGVNYDELDAFIGTNGFFSMIFDFKAADLDVASGSEWFRPVAWTYEDLFKKIEISQLAIQKTGWGAPFIENHDQNRATTKYLKDNSTNPRAVKSLALMYFYLYGTPFIYQGQEIGMINFHRNSLEEFDDISSIDQYHRGMAEGLSAEEALSVINYRSRDHARTPMQWTDKGEVGFTSGKPWLSKTEISTERSVDNQIKDSDSVWNFYKKLIDIKKSSEHSTLTFGQIEFPTRKWEDVFLYRRFDENASYLVVVNFSNREVDLSEVTVDGNLLINNGCEININKGIVTLAPYGAMLLKEEE